MVVERGVEEIDSEAISYTEWIHEMTDTIVLSHVSCMLWAKSTERSKEVKIPQFEKQSPI